VAITQTELGRRIRRAREERGWSQENLAEAIGLTQSAVSRIEGGERAVDSLELASIARALRVSPLSLIEDNPFQVRLAARASALEAQELEPVLRRAETILEAGRLLDSLEITDPLVATNRPRIEIPALDDAVEEGKQLAARVRQALELGDQPVVDIAKIAESRFGLDIAIEDLPDGIAGLFVEHGDAALALIDSSGVPGRQRFTIAHEICHQLCGDADDVAEVIVDRYGFDRRHRERRANAFAAHFLMPERGLQKIIAGRPVDGQVVAELQYEFGVSHDALLWQLLNTRLISRTERKRFAMVGPKALAMLHGYVAEWEAANEQRGLARPPARLLRRALEAYRHGLVGVGLVASLLDQPDVAGLRRELADIGLGPESGWVDDTAEA